jgi:hypothetical protein
VPHKSVEYEFPQKDPEDPVAFCHLLGFGDKMPEVFLRVRNQCKTALLHCPGPRKDSANVYLKNSLEPCASQPV